MNNQKLKEKKVFITGGANGIGQAIVKAFIKEGAQVAFCDIDQKVGEEICRELNNNVCFYALDVKDVSSLTAVISQIFTEWGDLDIIINNVGVGNFAPLTETTVEDFDTVLSTNLRPVFVTSRLWAIHRNHPEGKKQYGRIINMASTRYLQSEPGSEGYAASKGGIIALTHALALSLSDYQITVNCISPGWIQNTGYEQLKITDHIQHPSGRVGKPEDIARMCLFLCDPENDFINGQNIVIDGGMTKKMIYKE